MLDTTLGTEAKHGHMELMVLRGAVAQNPLSVGNSVERQSSNPISKCKITALPLGRCVWCWVSSYGGG